MTKQEQLIIILLILAALIGTGLLYHRKFYQAQVTPEVVEAKEMGSIKEKEVVVDVKGACWRPGVYTLPDGARVKDIIERACPREDADLNGMNLARRLNDGERIFVPSRTVRDETPKADPSREGISNGARISKKININVASIEELESLPHIGPKIASYIVAYRNSHGAFRKVEAIKNVDKLGEATFKKIKGLITVE